MRILDGNIVRDMTPEEETEFISFHASLPEIPADAKDYENALSDLGVKFDD